MPIVAGRLIPRLSGFAAPDLRIASSQVWSQIQHLNGSSAQSTMPPSSSKRHIASRGCFLFRCSALAFKRNMLYRILPFLIIVTFLLTPLVLLLVFPSMPPKPPPAIGKASPCRDDPKGYTLGEMGICTHTCGKVCFPRVHGMCFSHEKVTVCDARSDVARGVWNRLPSQMVFRTEKKPRQKISIQQRGGSGTICEDQGVHWIQGLNMVADLTLMPTGKVGPNPHHEAEKIIPAILFSQLNEFKNSTLFWFADPTDPTMISKWSLGLLNVFSNDLNVTYLSPIGRGQAPICFEDVILFSGVTNSGYMPNVQTHDWFRNRVLKHCSVPAVNASRPIRDVIIVHRNNSMRNVKNHDLVRSTMEKRLKVPIKIAVPGPWEFCDQVKLVAEADIVLTPHGSQNANLVVLRPGATVIEVFPLLYYIDWYSHYLHAGRVRHYEVFGTWLSEKGSSMPLVMRLYAYLYGWQKCFFVKKCMNYGKNQQIYVDVGYLDRLLQSLINGCDVPVAHSDCALVSG